MNVKVVMTEDPITVGPETPLKDVAHVLVEHGVSGLPVVGAEGEVLGVISEADLLVKEAPAEVRSPFAWLLLKAADVESRAKLAARTAGEAMSSPAVCVQPEQTVYEAARKMMESGVKRLPVIDEDGRIVGIVTRADLMRAFTRSDDELRREIEQDLVLDTLWIPPGRVSVRVRQGDVTLEGRLDTETDAELLPKLVARVPGVISVSSDLEWIGEEKSRRIGRQR